LRLSQATACIGTRTAISLSRQSSRASRSHRERETEPHQECGISPANTNANVVCRISALTATFQILRGPGDSPAQAGRNRASGRNLCPKTTDSWAQIRVSTARGPETICPRLCGHRTRRAKTAGARPPGDACGLAALSSVPADSMMRRSSASRPGCRYVKEEQWLPQTPARVLTVDSSPSERTTVMQKCCI